MDLSRNKFYLYIEERIMVLLDKIKEIELGFKSLEGLMEISSSLPKRENRRLKMITIKLLWHKIK